MLSFWNSWINNPAQNCLLISWTGRNSAVVNTRKIVYGFLEQDETQRWPTHAKLFIDFLDGSKLSVSQHTHKLSTDFLTGRSPARANTKKLSTDFLTGSKPSGGTRNFRSGQNSVLANTRENIHWFFSRVKTQRWPTHAKIVCGFLERVETMRLPAHTYSLRISWTGSNHAFANTRKISHGLLWRVETQLANRRKNSLRIS